MHLLKRVTDCLVDVIFLLLIADRVGLLLPIQTRNTRHDIRQNTEQSN